MYAVGNIVMHPTAGVCEIDSVREENFTGEAKQYYVMHPVEKPERSTVYVPVDSEKLRLRKLLTKKEIVEVLRASVLEQIDWIDNNNLRKTTYMGILHSGEIHRIVALISRMHRQKEKVTELGKKFPVTDERIMHDAEKRIHQEFSYALNLTEEQIPEFVISHLEVFRKELLTPQA